MVEADALQEFCLCLAVAVEESHQQQFLAGVRVQGAQHGGGVAAVGTRELEGGKAQSLLARCTRQLR